MGRRPPLLGNGHGVVAGRLGRLYNPAGLAVLELRPKLVIELPVRAADQLLSTSFDERGDVFTGELPGPQTHIDILSAAGLLAMNSDGVQADPESLDRRLGKAERNVVIPVTGELLDQGSVDIHLGIFVVTDIEE